MNKRLIGWGIIFLGGRLSNRICAGGQKTYFPKEEGEGVKK